MLNEEPAQNQDLQMMGMLLPLGIEKGKDFKPGVADRGPIELGGSGSACLVVRSNVPEGEAFATICRQNISDIRFDILRECLAHLV
jgi:hypothetical protein